MRSFVVMMLVIQVVGGCGLFPEERFERRIERLGAGSKDEDEFILTSVFQSTDGVHEHSMGRELFNTLTKKVCSNPKLLIRLFEGYKEFRGQAPPCNYGTDCESCLFVELLVRDIREITDRPRKALYIIILASMFDNIDWMIGGTWDSVPIRFEQALQWVEANAPYAVYDDQLNRFTIDEPAKLARTPVQQSRQTWSRCK